MPRSTSAIFVPWPTQFRMQTASCFISVALVTGLISFVPTKGGGRNRSARWRYLRANADRADTPPDCRAACDSASSVAVEQTERRNSTMAVAFCAALTECVCVTTSGVEQDWVENLDDRNYRVGKTFAAVADRAGLRAVVDEHVP